MSIVRGIVGGGVESSSTTITIRYDGTALFPAFPTPSGSGLIYRHTTSGRLFQDSTIGADHWWWPIDFTPIAYTEDGASNPCRIVYEEDVPLYMTLVGATKGANANLVIDAGAGTKYAELAIATESSVRRMLMLWPASLDATTQYTAYVSGHNNALPRILVTQTQARLSAATTPIVNGVNTPSVDEPIFMLIDNRTADSNVSIFTPSTLIGQEATAPRWQTGVLGASYFGITNFDATASFAIKHLISVEL